jgi:WD40 repeat protein
MRIFRGHTDEVRGVAYTPDSATLATCGDDSTVRLWDVATGRMIRKLREVALDRPGNATAYDVAISPDGRWLASAWGDHRIRLWGLPDGREPVVLMGHRQSVTSLAFADSSTLVSGAGAHHPNAGEVACWSNLPGDGHQIVTLTRQGVWSVAVSPSTGLVACGTSAWSGAILFWQPNSSFGWPNSSDSVVPGLDAAKVRSLKFSPDGRSLAQANMSFDQAHQGGGVATVWDVDTSRPKFTLQGHTNRIKGLAYSPDGSMLATASQDGTVRLWDAETGVQRACYDWEMGRLGCVAFAPDGMTVAAGGQRDVVVWDVEL